MTQKVSHLSLKIKECSYDKNKLKMSSDIKPQFREIVDGVFNRWTALRLAVEHGMGGQNGLQVKITEFTCFCF